MDILQVKSTPNGQKWAFSRSKWRKMVTNGHFQGKNGPKWPKNGEKWSKSGQK